MLKKQKLIEVALGEQKADLVIKNAQLVNVLTEEVYEAEVAVVAGRVAGVGKGYEGEIEIDLKGAYLTPGFIDGHVHIESTMMLPHRFAQAVVPAGTTTVITDPHEIANVLGLHGISFMREASQNLPLRVYTMLPSCVPATEFETSGFELNSYDLSLLMDKEWVLGLAEMMNVPGVVNRDANIMAKIDLALKNNKRVDGHAPQVTGKELCAYIASGVTSDHECTDPEQALDKLRQGMYIMVREGSAARDLDALMPILQHNNDRKILFVTDDRHPEDIMIHINGMVQRAVENNVNPIKAIQMASLNIAEYFKLQDLGAIAPGYRADFNVFESMKDFTKPKMVFMGGKVVAQDGKLLESLENLKMPKTRGSVNVGWLEEDCFQIEAKGKKAKAIEVIPKQLLTNEVIVDVKTENGLAVADVENDVLKICVVERHRASGNIGKGFVKGFGIKRGAIASTVAHDSHNMIIVGTNDEDMYIAQKELVKSQGGKIVISDGKVLAKLPLPIAGLMSDQNMEYILEKSIELNKAAKDIGCVLEDPFMTMAFLALPVIPEIKMTDMGLFSSKTFNFIDMFDVETANV
ncbi:adenine deaminase [bacterium]|nr:adenine deaminase [bacterium]